MFMIRKKLDSQRGVSMVIALVFLLLCAMVGTVALGAASVSAGAVSRDRRTYRETAALTSAAGLLGKDLSNMVFTATETETETVTTTVTIIDSSVDPPKTQTKVKTTTEEAPPTFDLTGTDLFTGWTTGPQKIFENKGEETPIQFTFGSGVDIDGADRGLPQVTGRLTIDRNYTLTAVLTCGDSSLTMTFDAQVSLPDTTIGEPKTETKDNTTTVTTVTTETTTVRWSKPVSSGGATS